MRLYLSIGPPHQRGADIRREVGVVKINDLDPAQERVVDRAGGIQFPLLSRIDYYGSARYAGRDVARLSAEVVDLIREFPPQSGTVRALRLIRSACAEAEADGLTLYVDGD